MIDNECCFCWPLLDPNEEDRTTNAQHECHLDYTHDGPHRCKCGEERMRAHEVLPDAMVWSPNPQPEFVTKTGRILTDADIEALAEEAERGYEQR